MKAGWAIKTIADVCNVVNGGTPKTGVSDYWDGTHQWVTPAEMGKRSTPYIAKTERTITDSGMQNSSARLLPPLSVILSSRAPIGHLVINTEPMATNQGCKGLVPGDELDHKYLYYYLGSIVQLLNDLGTGATFKELSGGKLKEVPIPVPPIPEQQRIVAILDEAFACIATARAAAEQNRQNACALFESQLQSVFSQRGEGWMETTVGQLVRDGVIAKPQDGNHGDIHPTKADYVEVGIPFVMAADLLGGRVDTKGCRFISEQQARSLRIGFSVDQDVLLSHKGTIGRVAILETDQEFVMLTPQVTYYRVLNKSEISNHYLYFYFHSPKFVSQIERVAGAGSTRAYIGITKQLDLKVLLPPIAIQQQLAVKFKVLQDESRYLESLYARKLTALDELKQSLLHKAFSGNL